jgi:hypothetical protein
MILYTLILSTEEYSMATAEKRRPKQSATIRISEQSHRSLRELAAQSGEPMQTVLDKAIEEHRRQKFLAECHAAYTALQQDAPAWADYQAELAVWDVTLGDGLDTEDALEGPPADTGKAHG